LIDREIHLARALLVEGNALLRSVTAAQLRDAGVGHVATAGRVKEARLLLEHEPFDIVVCNREFEGSSDSGQDLLDELRRENLLPHSTVFLMVTSKATYAQVVEAAEAALDGLIVRPYTGALLIERLQEARNRKRELGDILRALDAGNTEAAFARALMRFSEGLPYANYCGRMAAELLLGMQRPDDAGRVFDKLVIATGTPWARLGVARARIASGDLVAARKMIAAVMADDPGSADAHDLAGRVLVEQCDFDGALVEYRTAAALTPGCLLRAQHAGALAFYQGSAAEALQLLDRTLGLGVQSKLFDAASLLLIAILRHDQGDARGVTAMREQLVKFRQRYPESVRLRRLESGCATLVALLTEERASALSTLRLLSAQAGDNDFDLEAGNMLLALWARLPEAMRPADEHMALVERVAMRYCISRAIGEVLLAASRRCEPAAGVIRRCQANLSTLTQTAMDRVLQGDPAGAVSLLLENGERTLNAKLLEMAGLLAHRHRAALPEADALAERASARVRRSCQGTNHIAGILRSGRSPGGLQIRGRKTTETADVIPA
jgi:CheY-like chemotaxis protein